MARLQFPRRPPRPVARPVALPWEAPPAETIMPSRDAAPHGAGWFESSWDLVCGLIVREGLPDDPDLDEWLGVYLHVDDLCADDVCADDTLSSVPRPRSEQAGSTS